MGAAPRSLSKITSPRGRMIPNAVKWNAHLWCKPGLLWCWSSQLFLYTWWPHHPPGTGTAASKSNGVTIKPLEDKYKLLTSFSQCQRVPARHIKEKAQVASAPSSPVPLRDFLHHRQSWMWFHLTKPHHAQGRLFFSNLLLEANPS